MLEAELRRTYLSDSLQTLVFIKRPKQVSNNSLSISTDSTNVLGIDNQLALLVKDLVESIDFRDVSSNKRNITSQVYWNTMPGQSKPFSYYSKNVIDPLYE